MLLSIGELGMYLPSFFEQLTDRVDIIRSLGAFIGELTLIHAIK